MEHVIIIIIKFDSEFSGGLKSLILKDTAV